MQKTVAGNNYKCSQTKRSVWLFYGREQNVYKKKENRYKSVCYIDGQLDATDLFVSLIARQYTEKHHKSDENITKEYLVKKQDMGCDNIEVQKSRKPSGLCGYLRSRRKKKQCRKDNR